jgi:hypothetical protein
MKQYETFDLQGVAKRARHYLTHMVDEAYDYLPYWFVQINEAPAYAKHVRVDDAELVASWYEAIVATRRILGKQPLATKVENAFKRHLMKSWGPMGLRYHEDYPWSQTNHSSFHEMAYILGALNRILEEEPGNKMAEKRSAALVRGMRKLVMHRKIRTFWSGDFPYADKIYEFPGDVYLRDGGWCDERVTGRGEMSIRNGMMLHSLVVRADRHGDKVALDLAEGMANHLLGISRYFNWKGEFFGHVHSAVWVASGLARLGRITGNDFYIEKAGKIHAYVKSISSSFGYVPEYAQWYPQTEVHCETCCIKDMIQCSLELIDCGEDHWDVVHKYLRNQLTEQQVQDGSFVSVDNTRKDENGHTWKDIDKRVAGGWSGGGEPNSVSLQRFRAVAGCCIGTAPQALQLVWDRIVTADKKFVTVNLPINRNSRLAKVEIGYPNDFSIRVTAKKPGAYRIRTFDWMGDKLEVRKNGRSVPVVFSEGCVLFPSVKKGDKLELRHPFEERVVAETVRGLNLRVKWRGPDVVDMDPPGLPLRLYQRELGVPKVYPAPVTGSSAAVSMAPTEQKK